MLKRSLSLATGAASAFLVTLALAALLLVVLLAQRNDRTIERLEMRSLMGRAQSIAHGLHFDQEQGWQVTLAPDVAAAFSPMYGRAIFAVADAEGRFLLGSGTEAPLVLLPDGSEARGFTLRRQERSWRGLALPVIVDAALLSVQVAEDLQHPDVLLDDAAAGFLHDVAWLVVPVFLALGCVMAWMLHRLKQPLRDLATQVNAIPGPDPRKRLDEALVPAELLTLVRALNNSLTRIEAAHAEQRAFVADAAHELRTPLAVLQAHLDLMADRGTAQALGRDLAVMERMVNQLLTIAELEDAALKPNTTIDLAAVVTDLAGMLRPLAELRSVRLELEGTERAIPILAEEESLSHAIVNLIENAIGHAPPGTAVTVAVKSGVYIEVSDAGSGVPEHERKLVFRRFWRSRRRLDRRRSGAGLGLAIVARAAEIHGGAVSVHDAPEGGALFRFSLPTMA